MQMMGSTTRRANCLSGWRLFVLSVFVAGCAMHYLHVPLPEDMGHRNFMQVAEFALRVMYKYPMRLFHYMGENWQLWWARKGLVMMSAPFNPWSMEDDRVVIEETEFDNVPVRVYIPKGHRRSRGAVVFIHGGGFVLMDVPSYDGVTRELARSLHMVVVSVEYRLAPEHIFPAGLNDCEAAIVHLMNVAYKKYDVDPDNIIVSGDSAGGNLAAIVAQRLHRREMERTLKAQILLYPVMQFADLLTPSYQLFYSRMPHAALLDPESIARWLLMYFGQKPTVEMVNSVLRNNHTSAMRKMESGFLEHAHHKHLPDEFIHFDHYVPPPTNYGDPQVSSILDDFVFHPDFTPLLQTDLSGLPPTMMVTMQYDILRDEGFWYARRLQEAGVPTMYKHYDNGFHAILNMHSQFALARQVMDDIVDYVHGQVQT